MKGAMNDMLKQADEMTKMIEQMKRMYALQQQLTAILTTRSHEAKEMAAIMDELRDHIADFEDFWRPIRSYFYWEKHCYDIPICWSLRAIFDCTRRCR